ncbi:MAG: phosphopantothenoylcysteine decarboxylase/phosphopantothenate--cysteine ligase [Bacteroidia bacterium]|jgi:phosphopantothenoylcysteine decarboxylase/phosphopantothenate--cysteine ligase
MSRLNNRHIVLGITGGIAAYKAAELVRRLKERGAEVHVVMTDAAQEFITPLTLQALSGNPVHTTLLDSNAEAAMGHIELARWADLLLVAPASADFLAQLAGGHAGNLLSTLWLACQSRKAIAPAMNQAMWADPATQRNIATLADAGAQVLGPAAGEQACGDVGLGRMLEAVQLADAAEELFRSRVLDGVKLLITAGPTREALDPVRYISNHSSGKMGYALARAAANAGATVTLISGPVALATPEAVERVDVSSAQDMFNAVMARAAGSDIFIGCAAVADYRPVSIAGQKIKKNDERMQLELVKNPDIIAAVAALNSRRPFTVGFAAETERLLEHARGKLQRKGLDLVIANNVATQGIGFNSDDNEVVLVSADAQRELPRMGKQQLADSLIVQLAELYTETL